MNAPAPAVDTVTVALTIEERTERARIKARDKSRAARARRPLKRGSIKQEAVDLLVYALMSNAEGDLADRLVMVEELPNGDTRDLGGRNHTAVQGCIERFLEKHGIRIEL